MKDLASSCKRLCAILCAILLCHTTLLAQQKRWEFEFTKEVNTLKPGGWMSATSTKSDYIKTERLKVIIDGEERTLSFLKNGKEEYAEQVERGIYIKKEEDVHIINLRTDFMGLSNMALYIADNGKFAIAHMQFLDNGYDSDILYEDYQATSTYGINAFCQSISQGTNKYFYDYETGWKARTQIVAKDNAAIYIDGTFKANGQWAGFLYPASYKVELRKESHRTLTDTINIKLFDEPKFICPALEPIKGVFSLNTTPSGAKVWVDGKYAGHTPLFIPDMLIGDYNIRIEKNYFETIYTQARIEENRLTSQSHTLVSSVPFTLTSYPDGSVLFYINDDKQWHRTPYSVNLPEGDYRILVPRQYNDRGTLKQERTIRVDSLNQTYNLALYTDNNYDLATFVGIDYDMGLQALAFNFGSNPGEHFMFDFNFYKGLRSSETIYWSAHKTASQNNYDLQSFKYNHWALSLRCGPTFWCGPYLRLSPQVGLQYLRLQEKAVGENNTMESMAKGGYVSGLVSMRIRVALAEHWGIHLTPQYRFNLTGNAVLPETSDIIDGWVNGFSLKAGVSFYFY